MADTINNIRPQSGDKEGKDIFFGLLRKYPCKIFDNQFCIFLAPHKNLWVTI